MYLRNPLCSRWDFEEMRIEEDVGLDFLKCKIERFCRARRPRRAVNPFFYSFGFYNFEFFDYNDFYMRKI